MEQSVEALRRLAETCVSARKLDAQDATTKGLLLLLQLKEESRKLAFKAEEEREETSRFKTRLEQAHLQLQNLLYEKEYYEKEIHECQSFRFKHSDSAIGLVPAEQFLASASPEVLTRIGEDPHKLMLERLRDELAQRKAMVAKLEELKKSKTATRQEVDKRKRTLDDLQQQLQGLEENAKPLQTILAPHLTLRGFARSADLLPLPLYIVYSQLAAVREALGLSIRVAILGSAVEAESFAKAQTQDPADANATDGAPGEPAGKQARLSPAPQALLAGAGVGGSASEDLYKVHPLSVLLEVQREANGRLQTIISVKFQYLVNLKLVTAHSDVRDDNVLLSALFPGDDGSASAFEGLAQLQGGTFKFDSSRPAKPYRWCQHLAGLDFAPPLPLATQLPQQGGPGSSEAVLEGLDSYRRQQRVVHVIDRLRAVKTGDEALKKILASLDRAPNPPDVSRYPKLPVSSIEKVEEIKVSSSSAPAAGGAASGKPPVRAAPSSRSGGTAPTERQQQPPTSLPPHMRGEVAGAEDGEVGRRSRVPTPVPDGTSTPAPAEPAPAVSAAPRAGADAGPGKGSEAMEDGEAAEEGEAGEREDGEHGEADMMEEDGGGAPGADDLVTRYLLTDILAAEGPNGGTGDAKPAVVVAKPASRLYRIIVRHKALLECEVLARLFLEYPLRPPLLLVKGVREVPRERRAQPKPIEDANLLAWLEAEANSVALSCVPPSASASTLLYQLLHLRLALDEFAASYSASGAVPNAAAAASADDLMGLLASKQRLRGRDRRVALPVLGLEGGVVAGR
ncbi:hypothetical protein HYH03_008313 [Edaphochlamys debaryana]|uniref:THO complex subunit 5 n=1 Tax=Edaphochlamys debaryana TaxID=47281 RepID=A0A836BZ17_9CHLO|nr:hypothetical protein HYH03_008313 [Edaphochlamys debaryana]|eukprot:KAG2493497.1 hypothetical protein HYH03_008313 [Edaphochlamys debaryana]